MKQAMKFTDLYRVAVATPAPPTPRNAFLYKVMQATGCSFATAVNWATGKHAPRRCDKERIARAMGIEVQVLFPDENLHTRED